MEKTERSVQFVFFDHGGTLAHNQKDTPEIVLEVVREYGYDFSLHEVSRANEETERYWRQKRLAPKNERFTRDALPEYYKNLLCALGVNRSIEDIARKVNEEWLDRSRVTLYPDTRPCLEALKQQGFQMGVISQNLLTEEQFRLLRLKHNGIDDFFSVVITSESRGYDKPDRRLYLKAAETAGQSPENTLHVGNDSELDVKGARSAGMHAVLLDRSGNSNLPSEERIGSLLELLRVLGNRS